MNKTCRSCGAVNLAEAIFCTTCGAMPIEESAPTHSPPSSYSPSYFSGGTYNDPHAQYPPPPPPGYPQGYSSGPLSSHHPGFAHGQAQPVQVVIVNQGKSKSTAALLAFFLGSLGIHRFYLGHNGIGITQLLLLLGGFLTCGITSIVAGVWAFIDFILILTGSINRDSQGKPLV